jgi:serine/threonine protein kinase
VSSTEIAVPPGDGESGRPLGPVGAPESDPLVGKRLGKHVLQRVLGRGSTGTVYEGRHVELNRRAAVKVLDEGSAEDALTVRRFMREARSVAALNHPNVAALYEVGEQDGRRFIVMELVRGGSAADYLDAGGAFGWRDATRVVAEACKGLAAAHAAGLVHRDVKPGNIMRSKADGAVKLVDFGLAKSLRPIVPPSGLAGSGSASGSGTHAIVVGPGDSVAGASTVDGGSLTDAGYSTSEAAADGRPIATAGTPEFMSPEQCNADPVDHRSDIYSLGATYHTLLTGRPPYPHHHRPTQIMAAHCFEPVPDPRDVNPSVPDGCAAVVARAMGKRPADRYQGAEDMLADLERLLAQESASSSGKFRVAQEESTGWMAHLRNQPPSSTELIVPTSPAAAAAQSAFDSVERRGSSASRLLPPPSEPRVETEVRDPAGMVPLAWLIAAAAVAGASLLTTAATLWWFLMGPGRRE